MVMKKIYIIVVVSLVAMATGCTKMNLDEVDEMGYDAGLGIPVCKYHASVFQVLSKIDTTGYVYTNPEDMSLHVYWTEEQKNFNFGFMQFGSGGKSNSWLDLESVGELRQLLENVPTGTAVQLPAGVYVCRDTVLYDFEYDTCSAGLGEEKECIVDSIKINKASIDLGINVQGLKLDKNNYIQLSFKLPSIKNCEKNSFTAIISSNKMNVSRIISQFVAEFYDQVVGVNIIEMDMEYKIVSSGTSYITKGARIDYSTQFNLIDYDTGYGRFWQKSPMYSEEIGVKMPEGIREIAAIGDSKLLFYNPEITMYIEHNLGADLLYTIEYLRTLDADGNEIAKASFNGSQSYSDYLERPWEPHKTAKDTLYFDRYFGETNKLFSKVPDSLAFKCHVNVGKENEGHKDFLVNPMKMIVDIEAHMEMTFDAGTSYTLRDTVDAPLAKLDTGFTNYVNIDEFNIILVAQNSLPTKVSADVVFLDSTYTEVCRKPIELECPEVDSRGVTIAPITQEVRLCFVGDDIRAILQTKYIAFKITVSGKDAESIISIHSDNAVDVDVSAYAKLRLTYVEF